MPKGRSVDPETRRKIYNRYTLGEPVRDIADSYGLSEGGTRTIIRKERRAVEEEMASREKVVAGDKRNGRLTSTTDPHRFEGTCVIGGRKESKAFIAVNAHNATEQWERWCQGLRDESEFVDRIERRQDDVAEPETQAEEPDDIDRYIAEWDKASVADILRRYEADELLRHEDADTIAAIECEERDIRIAELEAQVEELKAASTPDKVISATELDEPNLMSWFNDNGSFRVVCTSKPLYVLWAKAEQPRIYGVYPKMEAALKAVDKLNDIAAFLGSEGAFEVEETTWRML